MGRGPELYGGTLSRFWNTEEHVKIFGKTNVIRR